MENVNKQLLNVAEKLKKAGAAVPAPQAGGTIESAMRHGLSIALVIVEEAIAAAEQAQQAEPVAWLKYPRKKPQLMQVSLSEHLPVALKNSGWVSEPLYAQPPAVAVAVAVPDGYALVPIDPVLQQVNDQFVLAVLNWWWHRNNATQENTLCHELEESGLIPDWFKSHWIYQQDRTPNFGVHSSDITELIYRAMIAAAEQPK